MSSKAEVWEFYRPAWVVQIPTKTTDLGMAMANTATTNADVFNTIKILSANREMSAQAQTGRSVTFDKFEQLRNSWDELT